MTTRRLSALATALAIVALAAEGRADDLSYKLATEVSGYQDTDAVSVLSPSAHFQIDGVTKGWGVGAGLLVDVVTAASADVTASASPRWTDIRYVPSAEGHFQVGDVTLSVGGGASIENDYYAGNGTAGISIDLAQKTITPSFSYGFGYDVAGRRDTPLSVYGLAATRHAFAAAVVFVLDKATILVPSFSATVQLGDLEKPYRYLPTFAPGTEIGPGASREEVDRLRTGVRTIENAPESRHRYAATALLAHRFGRATLRVEERIYSDSWWLVASTTDSTMPIDFAGAYRIWPHLRFHAQTGVSFWERAYEVEQTAQGPVLPQLRIGDTELGPLMTGMLGVGFRIGDPKIGLTLTTDAMYTRFLDHLYLKSRVAGFGAVAFDVEVD